MPQHDATQAIEEWGRNGAPTVKGTNDFLNCYKKGYELTGITKLVTLWHAIGHKVRSCLSRAHGMHTSALTINVMSCSTMRRWCAHTCVEQGRLMKARSNSSLNSIS